jgi:hypothetical protein
MRPKNLHFIPDSMLPVDIVLSPTWWYKNAGMTFDRDFFFHPLKRIESEREMEQILYERWGQFGLGKNRDEDRPEVGAVHLAAGFLVSAMLGCDLTFSADNPPQVQPASRKNFDISVEDAFNSQIFKDFVKLTEALKTKCGYLSGDVNWGGILNIAVDIRGQELFSDMLEYPDQVQHFFSTIQDVIYRFVNFVQNKTGSSSISVNRNVAHFKEPVFLHSQCTHTMISETHYEQFLFAADVSWNRTYRPFGIHYCGEDPQRYAPVFARLPSLDFLDVGWGGNIKTLRDYLLNTFFNIRLSPVEIVHQTPTEIRECIRRRVIESNNPWLTGVCCINMDDQVSDENISAIFESVSELRTELAA